MNKIFIIGLPRTGTTSICSAMLDLGYTVAHTAYTQKTFEQAQVIADTPIFNDYQLLDKYYPNSKFIYLSRDSKKWTPSIQQLLNRMHTNLVRTDGGFNTFIKRCYKKSFSPFNLENINNDIFLSQCYQQHFTTAQHYFSTRKTDFLTINISEEDSYQKLLTFLNIEITRSHKDKTFEVINVGGKVTAWKDLKHQGKVESTKNGRISRLDYFSEREVQ
jgi:hypothetical protein